MKDSKWRRDGGWIKQIKLEGIRTGVVARCNNGRRGVKALLLYNSKSNDQVIR